MASELLKIFSLLPSHFFDNFDNLVYQHVSLIGFGINENQTYFRGVDYLINQAITAAFTLLGIGISDP